MPTRHDTAHVTTGSQAQQTILGSGPADPTRRPVRDSPVGTTQPSSPPVSEPAKRRRTVDTAQSSTPVQQSAVRNDDKRRIIITALPPRGVQYVTAGATSPRVLATPRQRRDPYGALSRCVCCRCGAASNLRVGLCV